MRWLLLKDIQILRRSPLLVVVLFLYAIVIGGLIGAAISRSPERPKIAFLNLVAKKGSTVDFAGEKVNLANYANQFFSEVTPIRVHTRQQAIDKVKSGAALAALVIPADIAQKINSGVQQAQVEVLYNGDALKQSLVQNKIDAQLAKANTRLSQKIRNVALGDLTTLANGGLINTPLGTKNMLGLRNSQQIVRRAIVTLPRGSPLRKQLEQVSGFADLALLGLDFAKPGLRAVSEPVTVKRTVISGRRTPLDAFAVAFAATVTLMFVAVLLAAGMLALEREEQAFGRLVRGLVSREGLLTEKVALAAGFAAVIALVMLGLMTAFIGVDGSRVPRWLLALAGGSAGFGALGVAIGALARDVRAASLLSFLLSLPIAFLALVPSGSVAGWVYDVIRVTSALFPFKPALQAVDSAVNGSSPGMGVPLLHLLALTVAFGAIARLALRRFG